MIVTGELEKLGLAQALSRYFSDKIDFDSIPAHGFTSVSCAGRRVFDPEGKLDPRPSDVEKLVHALYHEYRYPAVRRNRPGHVILVDDLELANWRQPQAAVDYFLSAVEAYLQRPGRDGQVLDPARMNEIREVLREHCSLHFFCPMPEAYFFAQGPALDAMRVGLAVQAQVKDGDPEEFTVTDTAYLGAVPDEIRRHHPKEYLRHLLRTESGTYRETRHGVDALRALSLADLMAIHGQHARFLRSLIADLSLMGGLNVPLGECHPLTDPRPRRARRTLRNV